MALHHPAGGSKADGRCGVIVGHVSIHTKQIQGVLLGAQKRMTEVGGSELKRKSRQQQIAGALLPLCSLPRQKSSPQNGKPLNLQPTRQKKKENPIAHKFKGCHSESCSKCST